MKKQEVRLMFFSGFYESIHDSVFNSETEMIMEDFPDKNWEDFRWEYDWQAYSKMYIRGINLELGLNLKFRELISPREYNFTTDKIICWITQEDVKKIVSAIKSETFDRLVKSRFTRRDGFIPFYSNYADDWREKKLPKWDAVELGTLLDAWIIDQEIDLDTLDFNAYEYCQGQRQFVSYKEK